MAVRPDGERSEHHGPGFNLSVNDPETVAGVLADLIIAASSEATLDTSARICVGIAGAGRERKARRLRTALAERLHLPPRAVLVTTDAKIALVGAFHGEPGALILAGTGSGCHALDGNGSYFRTGGWGPTLGDPGSGRSLGVGLIQLALEILESADPEAPGSEFANALARRLDVQATQAAVLDAAYAERTDVASLAPFAFQWTGRWIRVERLVREECAALVEQFLRLRERAGDCTKRLALRGGLTEEPAWRGLFEQELHARAADVTIQPPAGRPVDGALDLARML